MIESIASNSYQWPTTRVNSGKKVAGVHELSEVYALSAQIAFLTNMLKVVTTSSSVVSASRVVSVSPLSSVSPCHATWQPSPELRREGLTAITTVRLRTGETYCG